MSELLSSSQRKKVTTHTFLVKKQRGEVISMLTAYDYPTALAVDRAGIDSILVGDSLGMVVLGYENTLPVTMDNMLHHCRAVARGARYALLVGDLPFMSYQVSPEDALRSAGRVMKETRCEAVKLEGGEWVAPTVKRLVQAGVPVMGHIGLTPQSVHVLGGFRTQGRDEETGRRLRSDADALADAGAFAIVLELVAPELAGEITSSVEVPTIGIGSGAACSGQVQVLHDLLGLFPDRTYRHAKRYAEIGVAIREAVRAYAREVREGAFP